MKLNKLSLKDKEIFRRYLSLGRHQLAVYSFQNIYPWKALFEISWAEVQGSLCVFFRDKIGSFLYLTPLIKKPDPRIVEKVFQVMDSFNTNRLISRIENVEEKDLGFYQNFGYQVIEKPGDYLYLRRKLIELKGNKFKSKRAGINYFQKHYEFGYLAYHSSDKKECLQLARDWASLRKQKCSDDFYQGLLGDNLAVLDELLGSFDGLSFLGRVVKINGKIKAFTIGAQINRGTFCIFYEIVDLSIKGLAQFIFREFCAELKSYRYINAMDDSGLENLKRTKLSYYPTKLIPAYIVQRKDE